MFVQLLPNHLTFDFLIYKVRGWIGFGKNAMLFSILYMHEKCPLAVGFTNPFHAEPVPI